ncbi:hypothetical protein ACFQ2M_21825 [Kitasatospora saccharophila]|uniref:hypothetical protein n=1 Tax=Kitasatospora saccharophila TaxID=407973 RepID=UPI00364094FE
MHLLLRGGPTAADAPGPRTGGLPLAPAGFGWPHCRECESSLLFIAHLPLDHGTAAVFLCDFDPGLCSGWAADDGANRAYLFPPGTPLLPAPAPTSDESDAPTLLPATALHPASHPDDRPEAGRVGGTPGWLQDPEIPSCPGCASPMEFAAQLENDDTGINFGDDGRGYLFTCRPCTRAAFLWQC